MFHEKVLNHHLEKDHELRKHWSPRPLTPIRHNLVEEIVHAEHQTMPKSGFTM